MGKDIERPDFSFASLILGATLLFAVLLSGCVTQKYENDTPVVQNQANRDEMAATRISLGLGYLKMGNMSQAKLNLEKAKQFSPQLVQVHTAFAHYYEVVGENELTSQSYEKALLIKADDADTLNNYGVFLCRQKKVDAAEIQFLKAIAVPSYLLVAKSYENLASCYLEIDNFDKAELYLEKAIDHSPNRTSTLLQMVRLQYAKTDYLEAKIYQQKFERHTRRFTADSLALAYKVYQKLGQRRTARNYGAMLVKMHPQSWESKQYLLNELELIDADNLAKRYQATQRQLNRDSLISSSKKRVVKLSPKSKNAVTTSTASLATAKKSVPKLDETKATEIVNDTAKETAKELAILSSEETPEIPVPSLKTSTISNLADKSALVIDENMLATTGGINAVFTAVDTVENTVKSTVKDTVIVSSEKTVSNPDLDAEVDSEMNSTLTDSTTSDTTLSTVVSVDERSTSENELPIIPAASTNIDLDSSVNSEPTSTAPTPAKRDIPLPEAIAFVAVEENKYNIKETLLESTPIVTETSTVSTDIDTDIVTNEVAHEVVDKKSAVITSVDKSIKAEPLEAKISETELVESELVETETVGSEATAKELSESQRIDNEENSIVKEQNSIANEQSSDDVIVKDEAIVKDESIEKSQIIFHQVSDGETLYAISVKYNVKLKALRKWNKISSKHKLQINEKLYVVNPETVTDIND